MLFPPLGKGHSFHPILRVFMVLKRSIEKHKDSRDSCPRAGRWVALALGWTGTHWKGLLVSLGVRGGGRRRSSESRVSLKCPGLCSLRFPICQGRQLCQSASLPGLWGACGALPRIFGEKTLLGQLIVPGVKTGPGRLPGGSLVLFS